MRADDDLGRLSLLVLFREEAQTQTRVLSDALLTLEHLPRDEPALESCMRAAHSLKGAARIIGLQDGVDIAHRMEEYFVAAQRGELTLSASHIDALLGGADLLLRIGEANPTTPFTRAEVDAFFARLPAPGTTPHDTQAIRHDVETALALDEQNIVAICRTAVDDASHITRSMAEFSATPAAARPTSIRSDLEQDPNRMLRVRANSLDRLLSLSGESLVESRRLKPYNEAMLRVKRTQRDAARALDTIYDTLAECLDPLTLTALNEVRQTLGNTQQLLGARIDELDRFDRRSSNLAQQLYNEALQCRMRPFGDATHAYPRIVRDLARSLSKHVRFSIVGEATQVDRDILDMLDAPLGHLLRNALDHGIETPEQRTASGKPAEAKVTLEARHSAGKLLISVSDDGVGIDLDRVRAAVIRRKLADTKTVANLSDQELLEFLLLPGFSLSEQVTDVSGRGVGLDAVHEMVKTVRGTVRIFNEPGRGARFVLQLPLTLSVIRSLLVQVGGEACAPHARTRAQRHRHA